MFSLPAISHILSYAGITLYFGGAALLFGLSFRRDPDSRGRRTLAFILAMWGLAYLVSILQSRLYIAAAFHPMSVVTLIVGNFYIIVSLLYPLELARPGWIGVRHVTLLLLPFLAVSGLFFIILGIRGEAVRDLDSLTSLLTHFGEFNVWYRFALYLSVCFYLVYMLMHSGVAAFSSQPLPGDEIPAPGRRLRRLRIYGVGMIGITLAYLGVLLLGTPASLLVHRSITIALFGIVIFSAVYRPGKNPVKSTGS